MFRFRVTKYDPQYRDATGAYKRDEWTSRGDIGRTYDGIVFTEQEYQRVEDAYATAADAFMRESGIQALTVTALENYFDVPLTFNDGAVLDLDEAVRVVRRVLREQFWCRLEGEGAYIDIGYDYYMYIGVPKLCPAAEQLARKLGLFVEPQPSA